MYYIFYEHKMIALGQQWLFKILCHSFNVSAVMIGLWIHNCGFMFYALGG